MTKKLLTESEIQLLQSQNTRHKIKIGENLYTPGKIDVEAALNSYRIPFTDFKGKRVLDIGCWTGGFSFHFESLGADVTAVDVMDPEESGFNLFKSVLESSVKFEKLSVYDLDLNTIGTFDYVFFQGVFYHLKHPLLAFEKLNDIIKPKGSLLCSGTSGDYYFENGGKTIVPNKEVPQIGDFPMAFFVRDKFLGDASNWWLPNERCLEAWAKRSGFKCKWITTKEGGESISGEPRSVTKFVAIKVGPVEPEHPF